MARPIITSREDWLQAGFQALVSDGPDSISAEGIARRLGVTKGGFYGVFGALARYHDAMMAVWKDQAVEQVIQSLDEITSPRDRLYALVEVASAPTPDPWGGPLAEPAIRAWALGSPVIAQAVAQVDERRLAWLEDVFKEMGATDQAARVFYAGYLGAVALYPQAGADMEAHLRQLLDWIQ